VEDIGVGVWITAGLVIAVICYITIWVTNKAYSKKWEEDEPNQ
jgi:hypothetical protein